MKMTTTTTLVLEALTRADDFMTAHQLSEATGRSMNRVFAAVHHLKIHKAIEVIEVDNVLYWYATPDSDDRNHVVQEKVEETKPRKPRKRAKKPTP